jgi:hypothetical protein
LVFLRSKLERQVFQNDVYYKGKGKGAPITGHEGPEGE